MASAAAPLQFRVLGPLEVWDEGRPLRLGGERQRALLALLLLQSNRPVSSERLIDELFGEDAAESAVNAVQAAVSRLRRVLGGDGVIETRGGGYVLNAAPEQLDVAVFEALLAAGRDSLASGDAIGAAARLREALALWRGPALADLALLEFAQPEIRRLEELRLAALQDRIEADLAVGRAEDLVPELEALVAAHPLQERLRGQLMLALYRSGRQADALRAYRDTRELLSEELGLEPSRALQKLERSMLRQDRSLEPRAAVVVEEATVCPFKGLAPFSFDDGEYFFGRERLVADLIARLASGPFAGVVGPSGSGKSSLLQAGLLPALSAGALPGSDRWSLRVIRPSSPLEAAQVLVVDRLEEIFTLADEGERSTFLERLCELAELQTRVVVSLRADLYGRCAAYPRFAELLSSNHVLVGPLERDELARAIELPASRAGLQVERELVDALVADVAGEPGGLPLLQTMLLELWRDRSGRVLQHEAYRRSGGVRGAVARLAEQAYGSLDVDDQPVARRIMLRFALRPIPLDALGPAEARVAASLTDARLLTVSDGFVELSHEALLREWPRLRAWLDEDAEGRRLHAHLSAAAEEWGRGRDPADLYRGARLAAALDWVTAHPNEPSALEREFLAASRHAGESRLRRLRFLLAGATALLALAVVAGVVAVAQERNAQHQARVALAQRLGSAAIVEPRIDRAMLLAREAVDLDRSRDTEGTLLTTLLRSPALLGTLTFPIDARPSSGGITVSRDGRMLVVGDNHGALRFFDVRGRRETRRPFTGALGYLSTDFSRDGSELLTAAAGFPPAGLQLLDARTLRRRRLLPFDRLFLHPPIDTGAVLPLGLSRDGKSAFFAYDLVVDDVGTEGAAFLDTWDIRSGKRAHVRLGSPNVVAGAFLGNGGRIVTVTSRAVETWDTATLRRVHDVRLPIRLGGYASISPDGRRVAGLRAGTASVVFIDARSGRVIPAGASLSGGGVLSIHFAPDSRTVVTTGDDGDVLLWDATTGSLVETLRGHGGRVVASAFSPDGRTLFTDALDSSILEWDVAGSRRFGRPFRIGAQPREVPNVPQTPPLAVAPDGSRLVVREGRSEVAVYSLATRRRLEVERARVGTVTAVAWSARGALAVAGTTGAVDLDGHLLTRLHRPVQGIAFSPSGRLVAAVDLERLAIWRTETGASTTTPLGRTGTAVAFSPDGKRVAAGRDDGSVLIVGAADGRIEHVLHPIGAPNVSVAFSPDGTVLTGSWSGIVERWNATSGSRIGHPLLAAAAPVASISFGHDPDVFATAGLSDGLAKLWTTSTMEQFGASFPGPPGALGHAVLMPGRLIVAYDDGTAALWPTSLRAWETHACAVAGRNLTREEWRRFVPSHAYAETCS